jgi:hypothetical protein
VEASFGALAATSVTLQWRVGSLPHCESFHRAMLPLAEGSFTDGYKMKYRVLTEIFVSEFCYLVANKYESILSKKCAQDIE